VGVQRCAQEQEEEDDDPQDHAGMVLPSEKGSNLARSAVS
jgi:hypothetical protein